MKYMDKILKGSALAIISFLLLTSVSAAGQDMNFSADSTIGTNMFSPLFSPFIKPFLPTSLLAATVFSNASAVTDAPIKPVEVEKTPYYSSGSVSTTTFPYDVFVSGRLKVIQPGTEATIIGDTTGNPRGVRSLEVQSTTNGQPTWIASGLESIAVGINNISSNTHSISVGYSNVSKGNSSSAFGLGNTANSDNSQGFGMNNILNGEGSLAFGFANLLNGDDSLVFGREILNSVNGSLMIGPNNNAKMTILFGGNIGVGTVNPSAKFTVQGTSGSAESLLKVASPSGVSFLEVDSKGHMTSGGTAPTLSVCGASPSISGNDIAGTVTVGSGANGCTISFANTYNSVPHCVVASQVLNPSNTTIFSYSVSAKAITVSQLGLGGIKVNYICYQ